MSEEKNKEGRHVGLDFYDLLIEALKTLAVASRPPARAAENWNGGWLTRSISQLEIQGLISRGVPTRTNFQISSNLVGYAMQPLVQSRKVYVLPTHAYCLGSPCNMMPPPELTLFLLAFADEERGVVHTLIN